MAAILAIAKNKNPTQITAKGTAAAPGFVPQYLVCSDAELAFLKTALKPLNGDAEPESYVFSQEGIEFVYPIGEDRKPWMLKMATSGDLIQAGVLMDKVTAGYGVVISRAQNSYEWKSLPNPNPNPVTTPTGGHDDIMGLAGGAAAAQAQFQANVEAMLGRICTALNC